MYRLLVLLMVFLFWCTVWVENVRAGKEFETFDGRVYNGKFYPRIDIIEWGQPSTMQFQVWWKGHPVEMTFKLSEIDGKKVMLVHYYIVERKEHLCRHLTAPSHFTEKFEAYESKDSDRDMVILAMSGSDEVKKLKKLELKKYEPCPEEAEENDVESVPKAIPEKPADPKSKEEKFRTPDGAVKKSGSESPFYDW